jgi:hypothetical protein
VRSGVAGNKASIFEAANIREWRGHDVVDAGPPLNDRMERRIG